MIADLTASTDAIKNLVHGRHVKAEMQVSLAGKHQVMLDKLKDFSGDDFENQYRSDPISGNKDAVDL